MRELYLLQLYQQQNEEQGKSGSIAELDLVTRHGKKPEVLNAFFFSNFIDNILWNPSSLIPGRKSGAKKTYLSVVGSGKGTHTQTHGA